VDFGKGTVFVLGAGFTKAFLPRAPLVEDDYGARALLAEIQGGEFQHARTILEEELSLCGNGNINVERLMTRLEGRMPYDVEHRAEKQLDFLHSAIAQRFVKRIRDARESGDFQQAELHMFVAHVITNEVHCITFNYDELLDNGLCELRGDYDVIPRWNPDRGYGFPCRSSDTCVRDAPRLRGPSSMLLLKLHGSLNWRVPLGYGKPYPLEVVRHHEEWFNCHPNEPKIPLAIIESVLEREPVLIPPVLSKTALVEQPILRFLWSRAYEALSEAKRVVFIGYSMPMTDISTGYLFREGLRHLDASKDITVVDYAENEESQRDKLASLHRAYGKVFPTIGAPRFDLTGARKWILDSLTRWLYDSKGQPIAFLFGKDVISRHGQFIGSMLDSSIVWGEGDGTSTYKGEVQGDRLLVYEGQLSSSKHVAVRRPTLPPIPPPNPQAVVGPIELGSGRRDLEIS
jgi:hypothetical protein